MSDSKLRLLNPEGIDAPFPWFGGKSKVAPIVWRYFGDVHHYIEPFFGSGAVLLSRPDPLPIETVNDKDAYIANFWRAVQHDPEGVAAFADWPVNESDLHARHYWLITTGQDRVAHIEGDPDFYDTKVAGWWLWGICAYMGGGWCRGDGSWCAKDGRLVKRESDEPGIPHSRPHVTNHGQGIHRKDVNIHQWMTLLQQRLRHVHVMCGDWTRILTDGVLSKTYTYGIFLDPPYDTSLRHKGLYSQEQDISTQVRQWAITHGNQPNLRIALCGYEDEHPMPNDWHTIPWTSGRCMARKTKTSNSNNRHKERIWFSPHCLPDAQQSLW